MAKRNTVPGREIYRGYYKVTRDGRVFRNRKGPSTYIGKELSPRHTTYYGVGAKGYVTLSCGKNLFTDIPVSKLIKRAFG